MAGNKLMSLITGYWLSQAVYVAAKLELADRVAEVPQGRTAEELATMTGTHGASLYRLLRALAGMGLFSQDEAGRFTLLPMGEPLRKQVPGSQWAMAIMNGEEHYRAWGELLSSVRTGETAFDKVYGKPVFEHLSEHPEQGAIFDAAMVGVHGRETAAMLQAYDFSSIPMLADIGGGNGSLLSAVLAQQPHLQGLLYDLPGVIARAEPFIAQAGLSDRCRLQAGNFFNSVPAGANAYLLRHILHDWTDVQCTQILQNIRRVIPREGKLLVIEFVVPPGNGWHFSKILDLTMLVIPGGKERTAEEYAELFAASGFRLTQIVPTTADVSVIEGVPAE